MSGTTVIILIAFVCYLLMMIVIGAIYMKKTSSSEDYFLGGRGLNGWVAALSAQASDMSGWLLMGLPGAIYSFGSGQIWIAVGLFIGTVLNWVCISGRLRKYTIEARKNGYIVGAGFYFRNNVYAVCTYIYGRDVSQLDIEGFTLNPNNSWDYFSWLVWTEDEYSESRFKKEIIVRLKQIKPFFISKQQENENTIPSLEQTPNSSIPHN